MKKYWVLAILIIMVSLVGVKALEAKKPKDEFYKTARFIMSKEEIDIYKHLASKEDKLDFIEEFWKKRDPSPTTEQNENQEEFHKRIAYANKWFQEASKGRGWDSERGRILLQLGFPDRREFGELSSKDRQGRLTSSKRTPMEIWKYYRYQLTLVFADYSDSGKLNMERVPSNLLTALNLAKYTLDLRDTKKSLKKSFRFSVKFNVNHFKITIPTKRVSFDSVGEKMKALFGITIYVYKNSKKICEIKKDKELIMTKDELLKAKTFDFDLEYELKDKGKYVFDVVLEDKNSTLKFREFCKTKKK